MEFGASIFFTEFQGSRHNPLRCEQELGITP
jgi:hypothetical protein